MTRLREALRPPTREAGPRELLEWARRMEIAAGVALVAGGCLAWNDGWWAWAMIGLGLLSLSGWGGVRTILRKAKRRPEILVTDPERQRTSVRRFAAIQVPLYAVGGAIAGYLVGGWGTAIFTGSLAGVSGALGGWWAVRRWS